MKATEEVVIDDIFRFIVILFNATNGTIWSSNTSASVKNLVAQLLDSGNLVVRDENDDRLENFLCLSFNYPTDTFLPGMSLGQNSMQFNNYTSHFNKTITTKQQNNFQFHAYISTLQPKNKTSTKQYILQHFNKTQACSILDNF